MDKTSVVPKKKRGPAPTGKGLQIGTRWPDATVAQIDDWRASQSDGPERSEAIRRLVEIGLSASKPRSVSTSSQRKRAAELAGDQIDDMVGTGPDGTAKKRRLTEGPWIFRSSRKDR